MNDISTLIYTNDSNLSIAKHCLLNFNKSLESLDIERFLVSNKFSNSSMFDGLNVTLLDSQVDFKEDASHFRDVMLFALKNIKTKYVFWILDDYWFFSKFKCEVLFNLLKIMEQQSIDHLSFMAYWYNWTPVQVDYSAFNLPENCLMEFDKKYFYMFSVQPSIWKRESLIRLLEHNDGLKVWQMDTTDVKNLKGTKRGYHNYEFWDTPSDFWDYNFNSVSLKRTDLTANFAFDERGANGDYFCFLYSEVIRQGKFNFHTHANNRLFLERYLAEHGITADTSEFSKYF
jgi:hypothetical protein